MPRWKVGGKKRFGGHALVRRSGVARTTVFSITENNQGGWGAGRGYWGSYLRERVRFQIGENGNLPL